MMRFEILRSTAFKPLFAAFGGVQSKSYLELGDDALRAKFGILFEETFPYSDIERVERDAHWPWYYGLGWRTNLAGKIGLVGSLANIVAIHFKPGRKARMLLEQKVDALYVSLEDPEAFCRELESRLLGRAPPEQGVGAG